MKRIVLPALLLFSAFSYSQEIAENKIDEFSHHAIKRTSWDLLVYKFNGSMYAHTRISRIDSSFYLNLRYVCRGACVMAEGDKFMLKLDNDSIIALPNLKLAAGCIGCGATGLPGSNALGLDLSFPITVDQLKDLCSHTITKVRLYLTDGYVEASPSSGNAQNLRKQAEIILK